MAGKRERCSGCGVQLLVPAEAQTIRCAVCHAVSRVHPTDSWLQAYDSISQAASSWVKGLVSNVSTQINSISTPSNNHPSLYASPGYPQASQLPPPMMLRPPSAHGKKRAVLCGVSYHRKRYKLKGSVNDVKCMKYFLEKMGFPNDSILMLTEDEGDPLRIPTKLNIRMALRWLVQGCQSGDSLVFHFSGHGSRQTDFNMDEVDGYDETLCPVDYETEGMIVDDEINETIVRPLPSGARLHAIVDACHSGTVLDLPYVCRMNREGEYMWEDQSPPSAVYKGTSGGLALSFSACDDHQTSVDTTAFSSNNKTSTGALTYIFIQAVQNEPGLTYGRLLVAMRNAIRQAKTGVRLTGPIASLVRRLFQIELSQEPQLSSSERFDIYSKPFVL